MDYWSLVNWFVYRLNGIRSSCGRNRLSVSYQLCEESQKHNQWMASGGGLSHCGLGLQGSENIAWLGWKPSQERAFQEVLNLWMGDWEHRQVMLSDGLVIGIAIYYTNDGVFGTLRVH